MKKFLAIVLAGLMLISISACGSKPAAEPTPAPAAPADTAEPAPDAAAPAPADNGEKPYIAVVSKGFQHQFWQVVKKGADQAAGAAAGAQPDDDTIEADYEVVDENEGK